MFGWYVKKEEPSAQSNLIDMLNIALSMADAAIEDTNEETLANFQTAVNACNREISKLSPTEQSKLSMFWTSGVVAQMGTLNMYEAVPAMKINIAKSMLPVIKPHILNTINALS